MGRRKTHAALVKAELGESLGHLRQAATHAAGGVGATVGPRVKAARGYVAPKAAKVRESASDGIGSTMAKLAPLAVAAAGARQAGTVARKAKAEDMRGMRRNRKQAAKAARAGKRRSTMTRLIAAGVVAAAVGTMAARRRRARQEWESYEPVGAMETIREDTTVAITTPDGSKGGTTGAGQAGRGSLSDQMREKATGPSAPPTTGPMAEGAKRAASRIGDKTEGALNNASTSTRGGSV
ncbi:MAG TPA: hypothetical protein VGD43_25065 [Micromonospora sp.]